MCYLTYFENYAFYFEDRRKKKNVFTLRKKKKNTNTIFSRTVFWLNVWPFFGLMRLGFQWETKNQLLDPTIYNSEKRRYVRKPTTATVRRFKNIRLFIYFFFKILFCIYTTSLFFFFFKRIIIIITHFDVSTLSSAYY